MSQVTMFQTGLEFDSLIFVICLGFSA